MIKGKDYAVTGTDNFVKTSNLSSMLLADGIDHSMAGSGMQLLFNATQASVLTDYAHAWLNNDSYVRIGGTLKVIMGLLMVMLVKFTMLIGQQIPEQAP